MLEWIRFGVVALLFLIGILHLFISLFGTFRMKYSLNRLHSSAITDAIVLLCFMVGCMLASGVNIISAKILFVLALQWCTSPLVAHMFVKAKVRTDDTVKQHCRLPECSDSETQSSDEEVQ